MFRLPLAAAAVAALLVPALALAKEPSQASISGPGFDKTLKLQPGSDFNGTPIATLTEESGFFPSAVGQSPDPMLPGRPAGRLGPRYTITWVVPGPPGMTTHSIRQDLYPYARGGAVAYTHPGQPIFDMKTRGGWYRNELLKPTLVRLGLPRQAPASSSGTNYALVAGLGIPGALAVVGAAGALARRRRREA
jgi:hypothetical protein